MYFPDLLLHLKKKKILLDYVEHNYVDYCFFIGMFFVFTVDFLSLPFGSTSNCCN